MRKGHLKLGPIYLKWSRVVLLTSGVLLLVATYNHMVHASVTTGLPDFTLWFTAKAFYAFGLILLLFGR